MNNGVLLSSLFPNTVLVIFLQKKTLVKNANRRR